MAALSDPLRYPPYSLLLTDFLSFLKTLRLLYPVCLHVCTCVFYQRCTKEIIRLAHAIIKLNIINAGLIQFERKKEKKKAQ